jgi:hypothetical protein
MCAAMCIVIALTSTVTAVQLQTAEKSLKMAYLAEDVDAYFGEDTYDWAEELARRMRLARKDYDTFVRKFFGVYDDGLWIRLDLFERINADIQAAFQQVAAHRKVDPTQFKPVLELFETVSDSVELDLGQLHGMFGIGLASGFLPFVKMFPFRELAQELKFYQQALNGLDVALSRAKRERNEARFDKAIDIFQGIVTFVFPEITIAKEIALGAGGLFADSRLGPGGPDSSKIARTTASTLKEPLLKVTKLTKSMGNIAGVASKFNAVYDVFDFSELDTAEDNIKAVVKAIAAEKAAHKRIVEGIWFRWRMRIITFQSALERANRELEASREILEQTRSALDEQKKIARYSPPIAWRIIP